MMHETGAMASRLYESFLLARTAMVVGKTSFVAGRGEHYRSRRSAFR